MPNPPRNPSPDLHDAPSDALLRWLSGAILPNLKAVQASQLEQIAANDRLERAIEELRLHLDSQFAQLSAQLTQCRAEIAAIQAALNAVRDRVQPCGPGALIH
jgi:septal ring factor EnvC (AmiA/AmiB activator)